MDSPGWLDWTAAERAEWNNPGLELSGLEPELFLEPELLLESWDSSSSSNSENRQRNHGRNHGRNPAARPAAMGSTSRALSKGY